MNIIKSIMAVSSVFVMILLASCNSETKVELANIESNPIQVKVKTAGDCEFEENIQVSGKVQSRQKSMIATKLMGNVLKTFVKVGDEVRSGQILATIDNSDLNAKMAQTNAAIVEAETALANINKDYSRISNLFEKSSATQKELDDVSMHKGIMQAKLEQAKEMKNEVLAMMDYAQIKAPSRGIITQKMINEGDLASPGRPLFQLESNKDFQVESMIPENIIGSIKEGDKVGVILKSNQQRIEGKVSEKSTSSFLTGGQYLVKIDLENTKKIDTELYSGMYVNVLIPTTQQKASEKILVSKSVLVENGQLNGIYTISDDNQAVLRWVRLGKEYGDKIEILSGLKKGEKFISDWDGRIFNGSAVQVGK